jgi:photosystem II stability/assembly factor-like uncharacterized protein
VSTKAILVLAVETATVALLACACDGSAESFAGRDVHAVRYASDRAGWAAGEDGLLMSTRDAGKTWTRLASGSTADLRALAVAVTRNGRFVGVAAGDDGTLLRTSDGETWRRVDTSLFETLRSAATTSDGSLLLVSGDSGTLLRSDDGGASWASIVVGSANVTEVTLHASGRLAVAVDDTGATWESRDRARHFECVHGTDGSLAQNVEP